MELFKDLFKTSAIGYRGLPYSLFKKYVQDDSATITECAEIADKATDVIFNYIGDDYKAAYCYSPQLCIIKITISSPQSIKIISQKIKTIEKEITLYTMYNNVKCKINNGLRIEIPLKNRLTIGFYDCINDPLAASMHLPLLIGRDADNKHFYIDLAEAPHMLVAGATGSGKSVCVNNCILSLLKYNSPDKLKLILIDPKQVEFSQYRGIKHLQKPIATDPTTALSYLKWAVDEMNKRYNKMTWKGARNINERPEMFPRLVIVIDELSNLIQTSKKEIEFYIETIAAKGRACGIHLIVATQNPTSKVITGRIKANIPTRLAFTTSSITDSKVIIDYGGAEKLNGKGDGLYVAPGIFNAKRFQSAYVSDEEIQSAVYYLKYGVVKK